jgi:hypothetical protein
VRAKGIAAVLTVTAALIVLALPAGAGAAQSYHLDASVAIQFEGQGTNGFGFVVFAFDQGSVIFSTSKELGEGGGQTVNYFALRKYGASGLDQGRIDLRIGKLGHFRGHFVAHSTGTQKLSSRCKGDPTTNEDGYFVGSFVFRGERGYTTIRAAREKGSITRQGAAVCVIPKEHRGHRPNRHTKQEREREEKEFRLVAGDAKGRLVLQASREEAPRELHSQPSDFQVTLAGGKAGNFDVSRSASVFEFDPNSTATFSVPNLAEPVEATLAPPAPFSGSATFHVDTPKSASWTGNLAVELPGLGKVPLTGKKIYAGLCKGRSDCTKTLPDQLVPLLEGGGFGSDVAGVVETQSIY